MTLPRLPDDSACVIHTERLVLEPLLRRHADVMFPVLDDAALYAFTGDAPPASVAALAARYAYLETRRSADGDELWLNWVIRARESDEVIGHVQATVGATETFVAWLVGTRWQGRGYASEAAATMVSWLNRIGATDIGACVHPRHQASQKVAQNAGLQRTDRVIDGEELWIQESTGIAR